MQENAIDAAGDSFGVLLGKTFIGKQYKDKRLGNDESDGICISSNEVQALGEEVHILWSRVRENSVSIGKFNWESEEESVEWRKARVRDYKFGNFLDIKFLLKFFFFGSGESLSELLKQLQSTTKIKSTCMTCRRLE